MDSERDDRLDQPPADAAGYSTEFARYRRPLLGVPWIAAALVIPALLVALGGFGRAVATPAAVTVAPATGGSGGAATSSATKSPANTAAPSTASSPTPSTPSGSGGTTSPTASTAPVLQITQVGKTVTVAGGVKDAATAASVVALVKAGYGAGYTVVNQLTANPDADSVDAGSFGALAVALKKAGGVIVVSQGKAVAISGVAPDANTRKGLLSALKRAFPGAKVTDADLLVGDPAKPPASCADTPNYVAVLTTLNRIQFTAGTTLTASSTAELAAIASALKKCPALKTAVAGNTDDRGGTATNQALSLRRAVAVKSRLVSLGVPTASVTAVGNGESKPIASNGTAAGQQLNRRVDITVT